LALGFCCSRVHDRDEAVAGEGVAHAKELGSRLDTLKDPGE